jgi:hypothetical protein
MADEPTVLEETKQYLGVELDSTEFNLELLSILNSRLQVMRQLGYGNDVIISKDSPWSEVITLDSSSISLLKEYMFVSTKIDFDPNGSANILAFLKEKKAEIEYRISLISLDEVV